MYTRLIIASVLALLLGSCATVGKNFSTAGLNQLRLQESTESDVLNLFGQPFKKQTRSEQGTEFSLVVYSYAQGTTRSGKARRLAVEFVQGLTNAYLFHSALGDDKSEFDIDARSQIVVGQSQKSDVIALLGAPHGEVIFPSLLLKNEFGALPEVVPPANAAKALVYNYVEVKRKKKLLNAHLKLLVVYLSDDDTVIEVRHFDGVM